MSQKVRNEQYSPEDARKIMRLWWKIRDAMLKQDYHFQTETELKTDSSEEAQIFSIDFQKDFVHQTAFLQNGEELFLNRQERTIHPHQLPDTPPLNLNWPYRRLERHDTIKWNFKGYNYKLRYHQSNQNYLFTPHALQAIVAGAVGEAALKAILKNLFSLRLEREQDCLPALFEVFDMKLLGAPVYIDAKNFGWATLFRFAADPGEPEFDEKLNSREFLKAAQKKWKYIVEKTGDENTKLVFINLIAGEHRPNEAWDSQLKKIEPYSYAESAITIIQGALQYESASDTYLVRNDLTDWVQDVKESLQKGG